MPRPHSPDCLLWAKRLSDEQNGLKARASELEKARERTALDLASIKRIDASMHELLETVENLTTRFVAVQEQVGKHWNALESLGNHVEARDQRLQKAIATQDIKSATLERDCTELGEELARLEGTCNAISRRLQAVENQTRERANASTKLARRDDQGDPTALGQVIRLIEERQASDRLMIQTIQQQVHSLIQQRDQVPVAGIPTLLVGGATPLVQEGPSPTHFSADSPLVDKQARSIANGRWRLDPPSARHRPPPEPHKALDATLQETSITSGQENVQPRPTVLKLRPNARKHRRRPQDHASSANSSKKRKVIPTHTDRQTRSRTKAATTQREPRVTVAPSATSPVVAASIEEIDTAHLAQIKSSDLAAALVPDLSPQAHRAKPRSRRKSRRTLSQSCELPPLDMLSD